MFPFTRFPSLLFAYLCSVYSGLEEIDSSDTANQLLSSKVTCQVQALIGWG